LFVACNIPPTNDTTPNREILHARITNPRERRTHGLQIRASGEILHARITNPRERRTHGLQIRTSGEFIVHRSKKLYIFALAKMPDILAEH
jgi:hypothetical protein